MSVFLDMSAVTLSKKHNLFLSHKCESCQESELQLAPIPIILFIHPNGQLYLSWGLKRAKQLCIIIGIRESAKVRPWQLHRSYWNMWYCVKFGSWIKSLATFKNKTWSWAWLLISIIPAPRSLRQETSLDYSESQTSLDCVVKYFLQTKTNRNQGKELSTTIK